MTTLTDPMSPAAARLYTVAADLHAATDPNPLLHALAEAQRVAHNAEADERAAAERRREADRIVRDLTERIARADHEHVTGPDHLTCTACGERREYRWARGTYRYAYLSETV